MGVVPTTKNKVTLIKSYFFSKMSFHRTGTTFKNQSTPYKSMISRFFIFALKVFYFQREPSLNINACLDEFYQRWNIRFDKEAFENRLYIWFHKDIEKYLYKNCHGNISTLSYHCFKSMISIYFHLHLICMPYLVAKSVNLNCGLT